MAKPKPLDQLRADIGVRLKREERLRVVIPPSHQNTHLFRQKCPCVRFFSESRV